MVEFRDKTEESRAESEETAAEEITVPENLNVSAEQAKRILDSAESETVTLSHLADEDRYLTEAPPFAYLLEDEHPQYLFTSKKYGLFVGSEGSIQPSSHRRMVFLVTDHRVLVIVGKKNCDEVFSVPLRSIRNSRCNARAGALKGLPCIWFDTDDDWYRVFVNPRYRRKEIDAATRFIEDEDGLNQEFLEEQHSQRTTEVFVCRECKSEISGDAETCPHCGFSPKSKKRGSLWWGTVAATSVGILAPVSATMAAKGASDHLKATQDVADSEERLLEEEPVDSTQVGIASDSDSDEAGDTARAEIDEYAEVLDELERLDALHERGTLSDDEFEDLKERLLAKLS